MPPKEAEDAAIAAAAAALSLDERNALEKKRYEGKPFTSLYYPCFYEHYIPNVAMRKQMQAVLRSHLPKCEDTGAEAPTPMRYIEGDPYYSVQALKRRGFCGPHDKEIVMPEEVLQEIFGYLAWWQDLVHCSQVSKRWLNAANYDTSAESDLMRVKRVLIGKEIYLQYLRRPSDPATNAFVARMEIAGLIGEWTAPGATSDERMRLASRIVFSPFYSKQLPFENVRALKPSAFANSDNFADEKPRKLVVNDNVVVEAPEDSTHPEEFVVTVKGEGKTLVCWLDILTGRILRMEEKKDEEKKDEEKKECDVEGSEQLPSQA